MSELRNDNRATDRVRDAAGWLDKSERTSSPAFENWLNRYRYQLAKVLAGETAEICAGQMQGRRGLARV
jgi:hypothetical protein